MVTLRPSGPAQVRETTRIEERPDIQDPDRPGIFIAQRFFGPAAEQRKRAEEAKEFTSSGGFKLPISITIQSDKQLKAGLGAGSFGAMGTKARQAVVELIISRQPDRSVVAKETTIGGEVIRIEDVPPSEALRKQLEKQEQIIKADRARAERIKTEEPGAAERIFKTLELQRKREKKELLEFQPKLPGNFPILKEKFEQIKEETKETLQLSGEFIGSIQTPIKEIPPEEELPELGKEAFSFLVGGTKEVVGTGAALIGTTAFAFGEGVKTFIPEFEIKVESPIKVQTPFGEFGGLFLTREKTAQIATLGAELILFERIFKLARGGDLFFGKAAAEIKTPTTTLPSLRPVPKETEIELLISRLKAEAKGGLEPTAKPSLIPQAAPPKKLPITEPLKTEAKEVKVSIQELSEKLEVQIPSKQKILTLAEKKIPRPRDLKRDIKAQGKEAKEALEDLSKAIEAEIPTKQKAVTILEMKLPRGRNVIKTEKDIIKAAEKETQRIAENLEETFIDLKAPSKIEIITTIEKKAPRPRDIKRDIAKEGADFQKTLQELSDKLDIGLKVETQRGGIALSRLKDKLIKTPGEREKEEFIKAIRGLKEEPTKKLEIKPGLKKEPPIKGIEIKGGKTATLLETETPGSALALGKTAGTSFRGKFIVVDFQDIGRRLKDFGTKGGEAFITGAKDLDLFKDAEEGKEKIAELGKPTPIKGEIPARGIILGPGEKEGEEQAQETERKAALKEAEAEKTIEITGAEPILKTEEVTEITEEVLGRAVFPKIETTTTTIIGTGEKVQGYDAIGFEKKKAVKLNEKPLSKNQALRVASTLIDNRTSASGTIKKRGLKIPKPITDPKPDLSKFTIKSTKKGIRLIEKNKFRIDTPGEVRGIPLEAKRLRKLGVI